MKKDELLTEQYRVDPTVNFRAGTIERARGGDGYDVMAKAEANDRWHAISGWGEDGWDLGDWPYVVIYARRYVPDLGHPPVFQVAYYVEGDVTVYQYGTKEEAFAAIDALAFFHWKHASESWVEGIATVDEMPERLCGPYGRDRTPAPRVAA